MAMTIEEQPAGKSYSRSPVLYLIYDDLTLTDTAMTYYARVYTWAGDFTPRPVDDYFQLQKSPNTFKSASFEVHNLLTGWFQDMTIILSGLHSTDMVFNVQVDFFFDSVENPVDFDTPNAQSNIVQFVDGYTPSIFGVNYDYAEFDDKFLTYRPTTARIPYDKYFSFSVEHEPTSNIESIYIENSEGENTFFDLTLITPIDSAEDTLLTFYAGSDEKEYGFTVIGKWYFLQGRGAGGVGEITEKYYFHVEESCKWGYLNLAFINKLGVWDYVQVWGRRDEMYKIKREEFMRSGLTETQSEYLELKDGQFKNTSIHGRESFTMNTGFVEEQMSEVIQQLFLSNTVRDAQTQIPYTIQNKRETFKRNVTTPNERLINYELKLESGYSLINSLT